MSFERRDVGGVVYYVSSLLEDAAVPHAFSTRVGGVSPAPFDSLNLGISRDSQVKDSRENILENYRRLAVAIGCAGRERCWASQVHGAEVRVARGGATFESGACADALVSDDPARLVSVKYADCVPILLASGDGRVAAAVHAGWRGVVAGVLPAAVRRVMELAGRDMADVVAAVGPCIGYENFEVGSEVLAEFEQVFRAAPPLRRKDSGKGHVDLKEAVRRQLVGVGVSDGRIDVSDHCTVGRPAEYFSHRRDGVATGRMAAVIGVRR
jgi:YfiH family protein